MFALCARNTQGLFYFHSFLIDMFFSLSFCMTWKKKKNGLKIQVWGEKHPLLKMSFMFRFVRQTFATAISKSSWVT